MTLDEFLDKLKATPGPWEMSGTALRCGPHCPISAVAQHGDLWTWRAAADLIGLSDPDATDIVFASDIGTPSNRALRQRLINATVNR